MTSIDRDSPVPIYHQLKLLIREQIESGVWRPGDRIPTEQELCRAYDISRSPVRQALSELAHEGVLIRRPGLGTFVSGDGADSAVTGEPLKMMSSDPYWSPVLERVSQAWNEEHPEQPISFQMEVVSHRRFYNLLTTAVGNGTAPDVAMVDVVWVAGLASSGFLYPLEELDSRWNHTAFREDLYSVFVAANSLDGRLYGLPVKADASLLWYRKEWFAREGMSPPQDWESLLAACDHFSQPAVRERYGHSHPLAFPGGPAGGEATVYNLMPLIWSLGGRIFHPETGAVVLDGPETRRAMAFLRDLVTEHRAAPPEVVTYRWDAAPRLLAEGKAAMALGGSYESDVIRDAGGWGREEFHAQVGCVAPPALPGGRAVSTVGGISYVVLRQCRRPRLVMEVLQAAVAPEVVGDLYRAMLQNLPRTSFESLLDPESDPLLTRAARMIAAGRARPAVPEYVKISRQLQAMFEAVIADDAPVEEIVARTADFIGAISERPCDHQ